jgi:hypothetical protein
MKRLFAFLLLMLALTAAVLAMGRKEAKETHKSVADTTAETGITGRVEIWEGNFMPMVEPARAQKQIRPGVNLRVRAYPPVRMDGSLATARRDSIPAVMVAETRSDTTGRFFLAVEPGQYSVFAEDSSGWYFNRFDSQGIQGAVTVTSGKATDVLIKITSRATF